MGKGKLEKHLQKEQNSLVKLRWPEMARFSFFFFLLRFACLLASSPCSRAKHHGILSPTSQENSGLGQLGKWTQKHARCLTSFLARTTARFGMWCTASVPHMGNCFLFSCFGRS